MKIQCSRWSHYYLKTQACKQNPFQQFPPRQPEMQNAHLILFLQFFFFLNWQVYTANGATNSSLGANHSVQNFKACQPSSCYRWFFQTHVHWPSRRNQWLITPWSCCFPRWNSLMLTSSTTLTSRRCPCLHYHFLSWLLPIGICCCDRMGRLEWPSTQ